MKNTKKLDKTSGRANQYEKAGNFDNALNDFYSLKPTNIQKRDNGTITGTLADGRSVNVRPSSRSEKPTIEIQNTPNNYTKIRYGD
ncbi:MAG: septum formation inhibitor Maf [Neisseriaceae bacterium]|nr:septum formation inhibitor Maf [Neisseriaceae bacterium]